MHRIAVGLIFVLIGLSGCKQDIGGISWDVDVLTPVVRTRLTMANMLADSLLQADAEGALRLKVETSLIDLPLDSILQIPDTTVSRAISLPVAVNDIQPGTALFPLTDVTQYDLGDLTLKKVTLRRGTLRLKVMSVLGSDVDFTYTIPGASKFGSVFQTTQSLGAGSITDTAQAVFEFDLTGYDIDLRGSSGIGFNTLETNYLLSTSPNGQVVSIGANEEFLILEYSFLDILPEFATGYFGQESVNVEDENSDIDVLKRITAGQMFLDSISIGLKLINGVGADAQFNINRLSSINNRQHTTVDLTHEIIGNTLLMSRAQNPTGHVEDVIPSELDYHLDIGNSNIKPFVENLPDQLGFSFDFLLNPLGNISAGNDFFYYDRPFKALMDIDIPLRATLTELTLVDTLAWDLSENRTIASVNHGIFTLSAVNGFPLEGIIELVLLDENLNVLDTLIAPSTIASAPVDQDDRVIAPLASAVTIPISQQVADELVSTKNIYISVRFNTASQPDLITFYASYGIDLKLVGNFNINFGASSF